MEIIKFDNVSFTYPGCTERALCDVSFSVHKSQFALLCGRSGCGKSTLLRHLKKSLMPYGNLSGRVLYNDTQISDISKRECASEIGFVGQNPDSQIVTDKVWHELAFGLESLGMDNPSIKRRVSEMASFFGIHTWFRKSVNELSGGQKQLLNLASVMVMKPKVLVLDEPTSQLDPITASEFISTLRKINQELGTTVIISEHRLEELFPLADKVLVMDEGRLVIDDTPHGAVSRIYGGECADMLHALPSVVKILTRLGAGDRCPLTVRDGRIWLENALGEPCVQTQANNSSPQNKTSEPTALSLKEVWFRYDKNSEDILRGLNLDVKKGEFMTVLGGNGAGKTTMLKLITKTLRSCGGTIEIMGKRTDKLSDKELFSHGISFLPQNPQALFTEITVFEELMEALQYEKLSDSEKGNQVSEVMGKMELSHLSESHPYDLSGGEQQRLALGKLLLLKPQILLLDEPTKGLDPFFKRTLAQIFKKLCSEGVTILMVTHDIEFSASYADRCAMFFDGEIVSCSDPIQFFSGNSFYTTYANRLAGDRFPDAVTWEEVARRCEEAMM